MKRRKIETTAVKDADFANQFAKKIMQIFIAKKGK